MTPADKIRLMELAKAICLGKQVQDVIEVYRKLKEEIEKK